MFAPFAGASAALRATEKRGRGGWERKDIERKEFSPSSDGYR